MNLKSATQKNEVEVLVKFLKSNPNKHTIERLHQILKSKPASVPELYQYGWAHGTLMLKTRFVSGTRLKQALPQLTSRECAQIYATCKIILKAWSSLGFQHGDLSSNNILIEKTGEYIKVWMVDWCILVPDKNSDLKALTKIFKPICPC